MRLKRHVKEETKYEFETGELSEILPKIEKECKPFLKEIRKYRSYLLYRNLKRKHLSIGGETWVKVTPRIDRKPSDIDIHTHKMLDRAFYELFGWKARSTGVFAIPKAWAGEEYDDIFFPIGRYKYIWSPDVLDMYMNNFIKDIDVIFRRKLKKVDKDEHEKVYNRVKDWIRNMKYTSKGMTSNTENEMMFMCKQYYLINRKYNDEVREWVHER